MQRRHRNIFHRGFIGDTSTSLLCRDVSGDDRRIPYRRDTGREDLKNLLCRDVSRDDSRISFLRDASRDDSRCTTMEMSS